ncbi:MAG: SBBP repeat-containing protein [Rhodospirillales bacterium]
MTGYSRLLAMGALVASVGWGLPAGAVTQLDADWAVSFGTSGTDQVTALATDSEGHLAIAGCVFRCPRGGCTDYGDAWVARLTADGRQLWRKRLGTPGYDCKWKVTVATDRVGDILIASSSNDAVDREAGDYDAWVAKYAAADGTRLWTRRFGTDQTDLVNAVATDGSGNVLVVGNTEGPIGGRYLGTGDGWLAKFRADGHGLWRRQIGTATYDEVWAVAVDATGNIYVAGDTLGAVSGVNQGSFDVFIIKYTADGRVLWRRQLGTSDGEFPLAAAVDANGDLVLSGQAFSDFAGPYQGGYYDAWLGKWNSAGDVLWLRQIGSEERESATALAIAADGDIVVGGDTGGSLGGPRTFGNFDTWMQVYGTDGTLLAQDQEGVLDPFTMGIAVFGNDIYLADTPYTCPTPVQPSCVHGGDAAIYHYTKP